MTTRVLGAQQQLNLGGRWFRPGRAVQRGLAGKVVSRTQGELSANRSKALAKPSHLAGSVEHLGVQTG